MANDRSEASCVLSDWRSAEVNRDAERGESGLANWRLTNQNPITIVTIQATTHAISKRAW